jgi:HEAT repeat protein
LNSLHENSPNERLRGKAAITLGRLGPGGRDAASALRAALNDTHLNVREAAAEVLRQIEGAR